MKTYIAMLRGINVSGHKMIKIADLVALLSELDFKNIRTYIQSGNLIFEYPESDQKELAKQIEQKILLRYKFDVPVIIRNRTELLKIQEKNPFIKRNEDIDKLYATFLDDEPELEIVKKIKETKFDSDEFEVIGKEVFLFCNNGYGKTKLTNGYFEKKFKTPATTRNWKTVIKLCEISESNR